MQLIKDKKYPNASEDRVSFNFFTEPPKEFDKEKVLVNYPPLVFLFYNNQYPFIHKNTELTLETLMFLLNICIIHGTQNYSQDAW